MCTRKAVELQFFEKKVFFVVRVTLSRRIAALRKCTFLVFFSLSLCFTRLNRVVCRRCRRFCLPPAICCASSNSSHRLYIDVAFGCMALYTLWRPSLLFLFVDRYYLLVVSWLFPQCTVAAVYYCHWHFSTISSITTRCTHWNDSFGHRLQLQSISIGSIVAVAGCWSFSRFTNWNSWACARSALLFTFRLFSLAQWNFKIRVYVCGAICTRWNGILESNAKNSKRRKIYLHRK